MKRKYQSSDEGLTKPALEPKNVLAPGTYWITVDHDLDFVLVGGDYHGCLYCSEAPAEFVDLMRQGIRESLHRLYGHSVILLRIRPDEFLAKG